MTDQAVPTETEPQADSKKAAVTAAPAAVPAVNPLAAAAAAAPKLPAPSKVPSTVEVSSAAASKTSNNTNKAAVPAAANAGAAPASKSSPSATKYTHPIPAKGAPVLPPVPIHHPYAYHHHYAYHQHMAATAKANKDPKNAGKPTTATKPAATVPPYNPAQYKKAAAGEKGKQAAGATAPPPMYPPPPHLPPHHHAYQQAWAAYRYAQQHSQYPPPPGAMPPWNADAYAAAHQAYAAAAAKTAAATGKGSTANNNNNSNKKGTTGEAGAAATGPVTAATGAPPHPHYPVPPPSGPYRYSDPTLRRDALSRISSSSETSKTGTTATKGSSPSSLPSHSNLSNSPPTPGSQGVAKVMVGANHTPPDPATLHMLELEARAEGATSPSQIEDFHREEVTTMGCTCKKTKCLKLYCQCFAVKIYCGGNCRCMTCNNTPMHEEARQEAIRAILSRNPTAFDTKFQKNNRKVVPPMVGGMIPQGASAANAVHGMDIPHARTISHKLGCKCRKSACIKKYCECYAGNVKCSSNCRCVGCKNMPPGGFGPPAPGASAAPAVKLTPTKNVMTTPVKKEPSWMMSAAQNLAFLKHGSAEKPKRVISRAPSETGSLASSSEDSPVSNKARAQANQVNGARTMASPSTAERAAVNALQSSEKTAVNALLMAAMAMTEMAGDITTTKRENRQDASTKNGATAVSSTAIASPMNHRESNNGNTNSPEATNRSMDEHFETPQRNLLKKFMSPKRKVSDRNAEEDMDIPSRNLASSDAYRERKYDDDDDDEEDSEDSPKRENPGGATPSLLQKVKRSRLGSVKKGARQLLERENSNGDQSLLEEASTTNNGVLPMEMSTPAKGTGGMNMADLTPVSARCIDFKKMRVNDSRSDPAVVDSGAL